MPFFTLNDTRNLFCVDVQTETEIVTSFNAVTERRVCLMFSTVFHTNVTNSALHIVVIVKWLYVIFIRLSYGYGTGHLHRSPPSVIHSFIY